MSAASVVIIQRQIEDTSRPELTRTATFAIYDLVMTESRQCFCPVREAVHSRFHSREFHVSCLVFGVSVVSGQNPKS